MKAKSSIIFILLGVMVGLVVFWNRAHSPVANPDPNHTHADFAVWINGEKWDFSDERYMSGLSTDESTHDEADEAHHQYVHLHDGNGDVLHRHKPGLSFTDFLTSLRWKIIGEGCIETDTGQSYCEGSGAVWRLFVNGEEMYSFAYSFNDTDQILLLYGDPNHLINYEMSNMTDEACLYSKTCPWKGDPPTENCIADPTIPCIVQ